MSSDRRPADPDNTALLAATLVSTGAVLPVYLLGALGGNLLHAVHTTPSWLGLTTAVFFLAAASTSPSGAALLRRLSDTTMLILIGTATIVFLLLIGICPTQPTALIVLFGLAGLVNGMCQPVVNAYLSRRTPSSRWGSVFAIRQSAIPAAILVAGLTVPLLAQVGSWRAPFFCGGLVSAVGIVLAWGVASGGGSGEPSDGTSPLHQRAPRWLLLLLPAVVGTGSAAAVSLGTFFVLTAEVAGGTSATASYVVAGGAVVCIISRLIAGRWVDSRGVSPMMLTTAMLTTGCLCYAMIALTKSVVVLYALTPLLFGAGWGWVGLATTAAVSAAPAAAATTTGMVQVGTYLGSAAGPALLGLASETLTVPGAWSLPAGLALCAAGLAAATARGLRRLDTP